MKKILLILSVLFALLSTRAKAQTFTFECVCGNIVAPNCDVCSATVQSRYFCGLYIKKNGTGFKWIDSPYIIKWQGNTAVIQEIIPAAETVSIAMSGTAYGTLDSFKMALNCRCVDGDTTALWHPSDSLNVGSVYRGDTLTIVGRGIVDVAFDSILNKYVITADTAGLGGLPQTLANTSDGTTHTVTLSAGGGSTQLVEGSGIGLATTGTTLNGVVTITATDPSTTNEIQRLDTFAIVSNILRASLLNDAVPFSSVDLSPYLGTGTVTSVAATAPAAGFTISGSPITSSGTFVFALSDDLAALEALSSTGIAARTASNTWALRTITAGTGISVADGSGAAGNPTITNTGDLSSTNEIQRLDTFTIVSNILRASLLNDGVPFSSVDLSSYAGNGTLTSLGYVAPAAGLTISGTNPATTTATWTYALANDLAALEALSSTGIPARTTTDTWALRTITAGTGISIADGNGVTGNPTVTNTGDLSNTNEIQTYSHSGTSNYSNTLSGGGGTFSLNSGTGITITQTAGAVTITNAGITTQEQVEDWVGALLDNTARIAFTYDDPTASITADIVTNSVGNSYIRQGVARSVIGVTGNGTANVADIQGTANQVLRVNAAGTILAFGQIVPAAILVAANNTIVGNIAGTNQSAQELTVANLYTLLGLSGTAGRNAYWSGTNTLSNSANWLWDNTNGRVTIIPQVAGLGAGTAALNISPPGAGSLTSMEALRSWGNINGNILSGLYNTNTTSTSNAIETISSGSNAAGDPILQFLIAGSGGAYTSMGLDNSDANKFKLSAAGATYPGNFVNSSFVITQDAVPLYGFNTDAPTVTVDVSGRVRASTHFIGTGGQWSSGNISFGTGAGTGPTLNSVSGTGNSLYVTFTTGTGPATSATIFTATYPTAYPNSTSWVTFSPKVATPVWPAVAASGSDTAITFTVGAAALTASTQYSMNFIFFGN